MSAEIETGDGCNVPQDELLRLFSIAGKSDAELHPDYVPVEGRGPGPILERHDPNKIIGHQVAVPTDRGLLLLMIFSELPEAREQR